MRYDEHVYKYRCQIELWDEMKDSTLFDEAELIRYATKFAWGRYPGRFFWGD